MQLGQFQGGMLHTIQETYRHNGVVKGLYRSAIFLPDSILRFEERRVATVEASTSLKAGLGSVYILVA